MAEKILRCFPDYGKAGPHYVIGIVELVEQYPPHIQDAFADLRTGIPSRCKFLPTIADFVTMAGEILSSEDKANSERARLDDLAARVQARRSLPLPPVGKPPIRYFAPGGVEMTETEADERLARHERNKANEQKLARRRAFTTELGNGNATEGEVIMLERGLSDVPADWVPQHTQAAE